MRIPQFTLFGFRRPREVVGSTLGKLEMAVMEEAWARGRLSVSEIHRAFGERTAYTTWMTTLDRLYKKGLLRREKEGRAYIYSPAVTREEFERGVAEDVLGGLLEQNSGGPEPLLACIVDAVSERDRALLDELHRLVEEKRRELEGGGAEGEE
jgi:predicted transcriptional regulator